MRANKTTLAPHLRGHVGAGRALVSVCCLLALAAAGCAPKASARQPPPTAVAPDGGATATAPARGAVEPTLPKGPDGNPP